MVKVRAARTYGRDHVKPGMRNYLLICYQILQARLFSLTKVEIPVLSAALRPTSATHATDFRTLPLFVTAG
jgi:hypothetical protein